MQKIKHFYSRKYMNRIYLRAIAYSVEKMLPVALDLGFPQKHNIFKNLKKIQKL